jgi:hypothetical protein
MISSVFKFSSNNWRLLVVVMTWQTVLTLATILTPSLFSRTSSSERHHQANSQKNLPIAHTPRPTALLRVAVQKSSSESDCATGDPAPTASDSNTVTISPQNSVTR